MGWQDGYNTGNMGNVNNAYGNVDNGYGNVNNVYSDVNNTYGEMGNGYGNVNNTYGVDYSSVNPQVDISRQYKKLERDYKKLAELQQGSQAGIIFEKNEMWDMNTRQLITQENKSIHTRLQGTMVPASELIIAQYMFRVEKQFEQQMGILAQAGYNGDPNFRISIQDTAAYVSAKGLKFQRIDEVTYVEQTAQGVCDVKHICDGGLVKGRYEEVPLALYDMVLRRDMQGNEMYLWKQITFPNCQDRLKFFYCSRCGTVLYTYSI